MLRAWNVGPAASGWNDAGAVLAASPETCADNVGANCPLRLQVLKDPACLLVHICT